MQSLHECSLVTLTLNSLFIRAGEFWWVSDEVGKKTGCWLKAKVESDKDKLDQPPLKGWQYYGGGKWKSDPTMVCSRQLSPAYTEIIVTLGGAAKEKQPHCAGSYLPVEGEHHRGRPVGFQLINFIDKLH